MEPAFRPLPSVPDHPALEREILELWEREGTFAELRELNRGGPPFSFMDGPITANNPAGVLVLAADLGCAHLTRRLEGELQGVLGARGEGVDGLAGVAALLGEDGAHLVHVRAGAAERLGRHVVSGDDPGQQVVRTYRVGPGGPGRGLAGPHHGIPGLTAQGLEKVAGPLAALLLHEVLEHLERVRPAEVAAAPDHAELPRALRAQVTRRALAPLLVKDLHARRPDTAVLANHQPNASSRNEIS